MNGEPATEFPLQAVQAAMEIILGENGQNAAEAGGVSSACDGRLLLTRDGRLETSLKSDCFRMWCCHIPRHVTFTCCCDG